MFVVGGGEDEVNEYTLTTGFDVSTASYSQRLSVNAQDNDPSGIAFNADGTKMFVTGMTGKDVNEWKHDGKGVNVIVIREVNDNLIESGEFRMLTKSYWGSDENEIAINDGVRLGTMLGKKLQVRNDEKSTKFNRLASGKIDKRLIAELGFGNDSVFHKVMLTDILQQFFIFLLMLVVQWVETNGEIQ